MCTHLAKSASISGGFDSRFLNSIYFRVKTTNYPPVTKVTVSVSLDSLTSVILPSSWLKVLV